MILTFLCLSGPTRPAIFSSFAYYPEIKGGLHFPIERPPKIWDKLPPCNADRWLSVVHRRWSTLHNFTMACNGLIPRSVYYILNDPTPEATPTKSDRNMVGVASGGYPLLIHLTWHFVGEWRHRNFDGKHHWLQWLAMSLHHLHCRCIGNSTHRSLCPSWRSEAYHHHYGSPTTWMDGWMNELIGMVGMV